MKLYLKILILAVAIVFSACKKDDSDSYDPLKDGLILHMPLNSSVEDLSGIVPIEEISIHSVHFVEDRNGDAASAILFNPEEESQISFENDTFCNANYTISLWFQPKGLPQQGELQSLVNIGGLAGSQGLAICNEYYEISGIAGSSYISPKQSNSVQTGYLPQIKQWVHIAYVRDTVSLTLYVNGVLDTKSDFENGLPYYSSNLVKIGCRWNNSQFIYGAIDDVFIYNRALTSGDIKLLFKQ